MERAQGGKGGQEEATHLELERLQERRSPRQLSQLTS